MDVVLTLFKHITVNLGTTSTISRSSSASLTISLLHRRALCPGSVPAYHLELFTLTTLSDLNHALSFQPIEATLWCHMHARDRRHAE